jgi:hypothetical protein
VCTPGKRIEVLLSERNPEPGQSNRQTLPPCGLPKLVALQGRAWLNLNKGGRALALLATHLPENLPAKRPGEPFPDQLSPDRKWPDEPWVDPLYLFGCGLFWRKWCLASAGWELIRCLRSSGQAARIAAAFLVQGEKMQQLAEERPRAIGSPRKPPLASQAAADAPQRRWRV